jgi:hypothetical protein
MLFFKANAAQATVVKNVLNTYAEATGQLMNPGKCSILFAESCPANLVQEVKQILDVSQEVFDPKYLGLPVPDGRMRKGQFESLQESLSNRLIDWAERYMASGAKEVLIKAVAQAIPTYVMSVFKLPASVCDELTKLVRQYWWGVENGKRKMAWLAWDKMILPKTHGGLGFRDMRMFNQPLLAKQAWRLIDNPESLCARLLKAKYYPSGNILDTVFTGNVSTVWQGIEYGLVLLKKGMIWRVGNGRNIRAWRDPWIPKGPTFRPISEKGECRYNRVSDFLDVHGSWNIGRLQKYFRPIDVEAIIKIRPSPRLQNDFLAWHPEKSGSFTVRSAYHLAVSDHILQYAGGAASSSPDGRSQCGT